jgi:CBS domain-containing protein
MTEAFDFTNPPFDLLTEPERRLLGDAVDVEFFPAGATILAPGETTDALHIIIKGTVAERSGDETVAVLAAGDTFDTASIVRGQTEHGFVVGEEALCYRLPRETALELTRRNTAFGAFFYRDIGRKLDALLARQDEREMGGLLRARVRDAYIHPAVIIDGAATIEHAGHTMRAHDTNTLFVREGDRLGIINGMNLSKAVVLRRLPLSTPVRDVCHFDIVSVDAGAFIFDALIQMTKHNKRRLAVRDNGDITGVLEEIDLLGLLSSNSMVVAGRIDRAASVADLRVAAEEIARTIRTLHAQGLGVDALAEIASDLNRRLFARLFDLVAPDAIRDNACLFVMGSEGRGEQILRTDQDNGLVLGAPVDEATLQRFRDDFSGALDSFGFPACPGHVMVNNPAWSRTADAFRTAIRRWIAQPGEQAHMNVAIFMDAAPVAGRSDLVHDLRETLFAEVAGNTGYLALFAKASDAFGTPFGLFGGLTGGQADGLDLKKFGIFPTVHGARSFALERGIRATGTVARLRALARDEVLERQVVEELISAFTLLRDLHLKAQTATAGTGQPALVKPESINAFQRSLLKDALQVVRSFRERVRHHFGRGMM